ncbi:MAG: alcohol dehydrogenase class IV [Nonlabens sp.]|jgi:alcohol dehydrogenase class IV
MRIDYQLRAQVRVGSLVSVLKEHQLKNRSRILLISTPSLLMNPSTQSLVEYLKSEVFLDVATVSADAPLKEIDYVVSSKEKPDFIIGIGGGSVIDSCKVLGYAWDGVTASNLFHNEVELREDKIPILVAPSTAGTGAELSFGAIIFDTESLVKGGVRGSKIQPDYVVLDTALVESAPRKLIAETGFDCLTHAIETYCVSVSNPLTKYQSIAAISTVLAHLEKAYNGDVESLGRMLIASSFMGLNLAFSRTCLPHRIQYVIGPLTRTSHAQGLVMLYNGWMPLVKQQTVFSELAEELGKNADTLFEDINRLKKALALNYRLGDFGIEKSDVSVIANKVTGDVDIDPCYTGIETIEQILTDSL